MRRLSLAALALATGLGLSALPASAQSPKPPLSAAPTSAAPLSTTATGGAATPATMPPMTKAPMARTTGTAGTMAPVNVNTATEAQLDAVPMIGPKRAGAIIAHRPYGSTDELVSKKALGKGVYDKVKAHLTVG